jgi:multidrug resistance efflux pump
VVRSVKDRWFLIAGSLLILGLAGGAGGFLYYRTRAAKAAPQPPAVQQPPQIEPGTELSYPSAVQARHVITVAAPADGTIEALEIEPGNDVFEGQVIARITNTALEAERDRAVQDLETAQGRLNNLESSLIAARLESSRAGADESRAQSEYERTERLAIREQNLFKEGATARLKMEKAVKDYEAAKREREALGQLARQARERVTAVTADIDIARKSVEEKTAALEEAKAELAAAEVLSPADGVLLAARAKAGEEVTTAVNDLFQIGVDLHEMQVSFEPDPPALKQLKSGLPALVQILDYSADAVEAEIASIEDGRVKVHFLSPDPSIKPGMAAVVKIRLP